MAGMNLCTRGRDPEFHCFTVMCMMMATHQSDAHRLADFSTSDRGMQPRARRQQEC